MKKTGIFKTMLGLLAGAAIVLSSFSITTLDAYAAHDIKATVSGTVLKGTDGQTLLLRTPQGDMVIKIDADTEASCKLLLPGSTVYVGVYYGNDAYMHAATISSNNTTTVDTSSYKTSTVSGTIADKPMENNIMYVNMGNDQMHVKLDANTNYSGCGVLYAGKNITMQVYRGDDAYMHAISISDGAGSTTAPTTVTYNNVSVSTTPVTGTVTADSKSGRLYLKSKDGTYDLKLDANTDYSNGYLLIEGKKITANIYRGDDAYMHVASFTRTGNLSNTSTGSTTMDFTGTVSSDSTDSTLYLKTSGGKMTIRLDANTRLNGSTPAFRGSTVTVSCVSCADEYWHAQTITVK